MVHSFSKLNSYIKKQIEQININSHLKTDIMDVKWRIWFPFSLFLGFIILVTSLEFMIENLKWDYYLKNKTPGIIGYSFILLLACIVIKVKYKLSLSAFGISARFFWHSLFLGSSIGFLCAITTTFINILFWHDDILPLFINEGFWLSPINLFLFYITYVLIGPFAEEVLFRGLFYPSFRRYFDVLPAMIFSTFIFSIGHFNPSQIASAFLLGLVTSYMYERTSSILLCYFIHANSNLWIFIQRLLYESY